PTKPLRASAGTPVARDDTVLVWGVVCFGVGWLFQKTGSRLAGRDDTVLVWGVVCFGVGWLFFGWTFVLILFF
ncbi:MAG TPA: hypothetical protein PLC91_03770, partial [Candidatus Cloacimonadota bacterium]|nr:hypothetical protein [Candidatus Cloacimonadota bacterium]